MFWLRLFLTGIMWSPEYGLAKQTGDTSVVVEDLLGYYSWDETYTANNPTVSKKFPVSFDHVFSLRLFQRTYETVNTIFVLGSIAMGEDFVLSLELASPTVNTIGSIPLRLLQPPYVTSYLCTKRYPGQFDQCVQARDENRPFQKEIVEPIIANLTHVQYLQETGMVILNGTAGSIVGKRASDPLLLEK